MRFLLFLIVVAMTLALESKASERIALHEQKGVDATTYNLRLYQGNVINTIWSKRVAFVDGKEPLEAYALAAWEISENGTIVVLGVNDFFGKLLQFDSKGKLLAELEAGGPWLQNVRRGGSLKLQPPASIQATSPDGVVTRFLIRDGKLADAAGRILEHPQPLQIGLQRSDTPSNTPPVSSAPAVSSNSMQPVSDAPKQTLETKPTMPTPSEEPTTLTQWSIIVVSIVAAIGLLWLLLKRRSWG